MREKLLEFNKNILLWYPFKEDTSVLCVGLNLNDFKDELNVQFKKISYENPEDDK